VIRHRAWCLLPLTLLVFSSERLVGEADAVRPGVAVLEAGATFENSWWVVEGAVLAQAVFEAALDESDRFRLVTGDELSDPLEGQKIWLSREISPANAVRLGRRLGVDYLVTGTLQQFGMSRRRPGEKKGKSGKVGLTKTFVVTFTVRVLDAADGSLIWASEGSAEGERQKTRARGEEEDSAAEAAEDRRLYETVLLPVLERLATDLALAQLPTPAGSATPDEAASLVE